MKTTNKLPRTQQGPATLQQDRAVGPAPEHEPGDFAGHQPVDPDKIDLDALPSSPARLRRRAAPLTIALVIGLVAAGGFFAGVRAQKGQAQVSSQAAGGQGPGGRVGGFAGPAAGQGGGPGGLPGGGGATFGQVKLVDGSNLYVTNAQGEVVKVTTSAGVKLTRMADATISDIKPGDTVIVRGSTNADGTITATSIADNGASGA